ncbi:MAG: hypothetical protein JWO84_716 [Parcubacteria group bacterium]|nr:hypothetical protein [Parcubacteria group bacterium]
MSMILSHLSITAIILTGCALLCLISNKGLRAYIRNEDRGLHPLHPQQKRLDRFGWTANSIGLLGTLLWFLAGLALLLLPFNDNTLSDGLKLGSALAGLGIIGSTIMLVSVNTWWIHRFVKEVEPSNGSFQPA